MCVCVCVYIVYNVGGDGFDHAVHLDHMDVSYVCVRARVNERGRRERARERERDYKYIIYYILYTVGVDGFDQVVHLQCMRP